MPEVITIITIMEALAYASWKGGHVVIHTTFRVAIYSQLQSMTNNNIYPLVTVQRSLAQVKGVIIN